MNRKKIELTCENESCKKIYKKDESEYKRNLKLGRKNYCSLKCSGTLNNKHLIPYSNSEKNKEFLKTINNNRINKYTGLREHLTRVRKRDKNYNITLDDLLEQWNKQKGICPYSGIELKLSNVKCSKIEKASLDRINSNMGYVKDNIQFISVICNYAKNDMTHENMVNFCKIITKEWINKL